MRFLGQVPEARRYFKAFDVFVSTVDHEPFGMVLLEALVAGVPVISADSGGAREVVEGAGQLFPLEDVEALARALVRREAPVERPQVDGKLERCFSDTAASRHFHRLLFWHELLIKQS